jgi:hypothetical protein
MMGACAGAPIARGPAVNAKRDQSIMNDDIFIDTILEAQAILARHIAGEHASAEETIAKLMQLLDGTELVKALAKKGFSSNAFE